MKQLEKSLKDGVFSPVYLFFGDEQYLLEEMVNKLKDFISPDRNSWNIDIFDGDGTSFDEVIAALEMTGFFSGRKLVLVKNPAWFKKKNKIKVDQEEDVEESEEENSSFSLKPLLDYLKAPNPDSIFLITINGNVDKRLKVVQEIKKAGRVIEFPSLNYKDNQMIYGRMNEFLKKRGQKAKTKVYDYLTLVAGYNLGFLYQELDKLSSYCLGKEEIELTDAEKIVSRGNLTIIFELTDAILEKDGEKSIEAFRALTREGEAEQKILIIIYKEIHDLIMVQELANRGLGSGEIAKEAGLHPFVAGKYYRMRRNFSPEQLLKALEMLLSVDIANKSGEGNLNNLLELAILRICAFSA